MNQNYSLNKDIAIKEIIKFFPDDFKIVSLAENARSLYHWVKISSILDSCFPMFGSMGQELAMGLGVAIGSSNYTQRKTLVITSDGSFLSNTNTLFTTAFFKPKNFIVILLDNEKHMITGGQPSASKIADLCKFAESCLFKSFFVKTRQELKKNLTLFRNYDGPLFLQVKINDKKATTENISELPPLLFFRFSNYITQLHGKNKKISIR